MEIPETLAWLDGIFPGEPELHQAAAADSLVFATYETGTENICATAGFAEVDTGLESGGMDVRSEFFTVTNASKSVTLPVVGAVAQLLERAEQTMQAQPWTLLPGIGTTVGLPAEITVRHGAFVVPQLWEGNVPQLVEDDRWTLLLQLVMLTEDEFNYGITYGVPDLFDEIKRMEIDVADWSR